MNKKSLILTFLMLIISLSFSLYKFQYTTDSEAISVMNNTPIEEVKLRALYTGEEVDEATFNKIPFMAIIENSEGARPQSGLSEADIVYETMAEGGIPRFIALFQKNSPEEIGPIRSARPYFTSISEEYNLPFAHCGGSEEALSYIQNNDLMSINEMKYGNYFWRDKSRKAPHNLYTSSSKLRNFISTKAYYKTNSPWRKFDATYWNRVELPNANNINLKLNANYSTQYTLKDGSYYKSMDNIISIDKANNKNIAVQNIVIQIADIKLQADGNHLDVNLIGKGDGYVISRGKYTKLHWSKDDINSPTVLKDESGNEIYLSQGKTWWHILDKKAVIDISK
jgi:hypothetical protein